MNRKETLVAYLRSCLDAGDWHGVRDAAVDIEKIEAVEAVPMSPVARGYDNSGRECTLPNGVVFYEEDCDCPECVALRSQLKAKKSWRPGSPGDPDPLLELGRRDAMRHPHDCSCISCAIAAKKLREAQGQIDMQGDVT